MSDFSDLEFETEFETDLNIEFPPIEILYYKWCLQKHNWCIKNTNELFKKKFSFDDIKTPLKMKKQSEHFPKIEDLKDNFEKIKVTTHALNQIILPEDNFKIEKEAGTGTKDWYYSEKFANEIFKILYYEEYMEKFIEKAKIDVKKKVKRDLQKVLNK
jgi:hypothetical protein